MKLIPEWKRAWRFYSVWAFAVIVALPELYNAAATLGLFDAAPATLLWSMRGLALAGIVARFVDQARPRIEDAK